MREQVSPVCLWPSHQSDGSLFSRCGDSFVPQGCYTDSKCQKGDKYGSPRLYQPLSCVLVLGFLAFLRRGDALLGCSFAGPRQRKVAVDPSMRSSGC